MKGPDQLYNIIIITADELRGDCLGYMGSPDVKTPELDAFAKRATTFENHYCNFPKCVPSRISLFTGRRPHTGGYRDIFQHLRPGEPDLKEWARKLNYETALFGKSHCWMGADFNEFVDVHSWSPRMMPFWEKRIPETIHFKDYGDGAKQESRRVGCCEGENNDEVYVEQSRSFLREMRQFSRPFMMVLNLEKPHTPYAVAEPWFSMYDRESIHPFPRQLPEGAPVSLRAQHEVRAKGITGENLRDIQAVYFGMISKVDHLLGKLFQDLDELALWDNSIVLFVSDHGDWASQFELSEKWDTSFNDCMIRIPCILHAPNLPGGNRVTGLSEMVDLAPTILGLMGTRPDWPVHGRDLRPVIAGTAAKEAVFCDGGHELAARERFRAMHGNTPIRRKGLFLDKQETYRRFPDSMARARMIRTLSHKMVIRETGDHELYDLQADPDELINIWQQDGTAKIIADLQLKLLLEDLRTDPDYPPLDQVGA